MESEVRTEKEILSEITGTFVVKPVKTTYLANIDKTHNGAVLFDRAIFSYAAERDPFTGLVNTGLTEEEARALESALNYTPKSLHPNNMKTKVQNGEFSWAHFSIKIPKEGLVINADRSARDKLYLKVLQAGSKVAKSSAELASDPMKYELVLVSEESEKKAKHSDVALKRKAFSKFSEMTIQDMVDFLDVYEEGMYKVGLESTPEFIEGEVGKIVDSKPQSYLDTVESSYYKTMVFLFKCLRANLIYKQGTKYMLIEGDVLGESLLEAVKNLESDDYNNVKLSLMTKLQSKDDMPTKTAPKKKVTKKKDDSTGDA